MEVTQSITNPVTKVTTREKVGEVIIHVPLVHDLIKEAVPTVVDGKPVFSDEGLPVYDDDKYNWIQAAIFAQVKAQARNKLVSKTAELKDGASIATDWEGLTAETAGGGAIHLQLVREVKALFAQWVATLGKTQGAVTKILGGFNDPKVLLVADSESKAKILGYVSDFVDTLDAETVQKYNKYLTKVTEAASSAEIEADDF